VRRLRLLRAWRDRVARGRSRAEPSRRRRSGSRSDGRRCPHVELDHTPDVAVDRRRAQRLASALAHPALHRSQHGEKRSRSQCLHSSVRMRAKDRQIPVFSAGLEGSTLLLSGAGRPHKSRGPAKPEGWTTGRHVATVGNCGPRSWPGKATRWPLRLQTGLRLLRSCPNRNGHTALYVLPPRPSLGRL
jgi:hypothetical protein